MINIQFRSYDFLYQEYIVNKKSGYDIAKELGCHGKTINNWLKRYKLFSKEKSHKIGAEKRKVKLEGKRFGNLLVIEKLSTGLWKCQCDCGNYKNIILSNLTGGISTSCGCNHKNKFTGHQEISGQFFSSIRISAEQRKIGFYIKIEDIWNLFLKQNRKCALSGVTLCFSSSTRLHNGNASLDRIDSTKDYTLDNIQWIHKDLNRMKNNLSEPEFFKWIDIIHTYKSSRQE